MTMFKRRNTPKGAKCIGHAFYMAEPQGFVGGPGGWLNGVLSDLEAQLDEAGGKRPYGIEFGGGDGKMMPVTVEMFEAA